MKAKTMEKTTAKLRSEPIGISACSVTACIPDTYAPHYSATGTMPDGTGTVTSHGATDGPRSLRMPGSQLAIVGG